MRSNLHLHSRVAVLLAFLVCWESSFWLWKNYDASADNKDALIHHHHFLDTEKAAIHHVPSTTISSTPEVQKSSDPEGNGRLLRHNRVLDELVELTTGGKDIGALKCPEPLVPVHNKVIWVQQEEDGRVFSSSIPRILHLTYKSRCLPPDLMEFIEKWKKVLPQFSIFFYDDDAVERTFVKGRGIFPMLDYVRRCILYSGAIKIDIWRILIIYIYGGLYSDIDNSLTNAFSERVFLTDSDKPQYTNITGWSLSDGSNRPSQGCFP